MWSWSRTITCTGTIRHMDDDARRSGHCETWPPTEHTAPCTDLTCQRRTQFALLEWCRIESACAEVWLAPRGPLLTRFLLASSCLFVSLCSFPSRQVAHDWIVQHRLALARHYLRDKRLSPSELKATGVADGCEDEYYLVRTTVIHAEWHRCFSLANLRLGCASFHPFSSSFFSRASTRLWRFSRFRTTRTPRRLPTRKCRTCSSVWTRMRAHPGPVVIWDSPLTHCIDRTCCFFLSYRRSLHHYWRGGGVRGVVSRADGGGRRPGGGR